MARSCGIRIGPRRFELVVLDGSAKRHKISAYHVGEFAPADAAAFAEGDISGVAAALKEAAKTHRIPSENIGVVMSTDHVAFRRVTLPFSDRAKIEQVLKFEIESELPQFDIDDVVVDFHVMSENDSGAELLVSAVPKHDIQTVIAACEKAGIEPLEIELEATAMVNAAFTADMCHIDDAQLLVHVGEHSTSVAVVAGAELREFRVIHIGAMTHLMRELDEADASEDAETEVTFDSDGNEVPLPGRADPISDIDLQRKVEQAVKRIKREIGRTISAARTPQTIEAIYVSGTEMPGLVGSEILGVPVYVLDCFDGDSGQPADGFGQLVAAYGGAVHQLGGGHLKPSLRRDELRYTGTWERLEFPLAFAALMLATFLGLMNIVQMQKLNWMNQTGAFQRLKLSNLYLVGSDTNPMSVPIMKRPRDSDAYKGLLDEYNALRDRAERYAAAASVRDLPEDLPSPIDEFSNVLTKVGKLAEEAGGLTGGNVDYEPPPSAFTAMTLVVDLLSSNPAWRPSIYDIKASYAQEKKGVWPEHTEVTLKVVFFAKDTVVASEHFDEFRNTLKTKPWFLELDPSSDKALPDSNGIIIESLSIHVDPKKAPEASN